MHLQQLQYVTFRVVMGGLLFQKSLMQLLHRLRKSGLRCGCSLLDAVIDPSVDLSFKPTYATSAKTYVLGELAALDAVID